MQEVEYLIAEAGCSNDTEQPESAMVIETGDEADEPEISCDDASKSKSCQTLPMEYFGKNKSTQTKKSAEMERSTKATKSTQTFLTGESLSKLLMPKTPIMISTCSQTDAIDTDVPNGGKITYNCQNVVVDVIELPKQPEAIEFENSDAVQQSVGESDGENSSDEEFMTTSDYDSELDEDSKEHDEPIMLTSTKSIKDQLKFIICEESIVKTFSVCMKCGSQCSVFIRSRVGSCCVICIACTSSAAHNISWSTGPLMNRLPALNLLIASSILSTGMECNKTLRFMESLNILCFKRRELSNIQSGYVIPAVFNVWKLKQQKLLTRIKDKSIIIASDMRVDSPGHSGLLGSGSTLDVERNVVLDTQVVKVTGF